MRIAKHKRRSRLGRLGRGLALGLAAFGALWGQGAMAYYIGPSFVQVPGLAGGAKDPKHAGWVRAEAYYWTVHPMLREIRGVTEATPSLLFTGPRAPEHGPDVLSIAVDKASPALKPMMDACRSGAPLPEVKFAESSERVRHPQEHGPRPADVPEFYEYRLKTVRLTCPVVEKAPEQAFALHFETIEWLNYKPQPKPRPITAEPAKLAPAPKHGASKVFVVSWMAAVADSRDDQCPKMNTKPSQADYYALMTPERAAAQRAALKDKGGADTQHLPYRGPDEMNVTLLPGIVPDPGFFEPAVDVVQGFNLDGDDGKGRPPRGVRKHKNYVSPDGETGIDNQLFALQGCIQGWRRRGFLPMISNDMRRAGALSILVEVSGIDNEQNDDDVAVTLMYSTDPMKRDGTSKIILPDYTFRVTDDPSYTQDFVRFHGKIVNGVLITEPLKKKIFVHEGPAGITWSLADARMRLQFLPDGSMKALMGGYRDWREVLAAAFFRSSDYENTIGFQAPGMYEAAKRAADGLQDPVTGEFTGISAAYELEGVPAFVPKAQDVRLAKGEPIRVASAP
jgi:type VI protein secretion system component Hcp